MCTTQVLLPPPFSHHFALALTSFFHLFHNLLLFIFFILPYSLLAKKRLLEIDGTLQKINSSHELVPQLW
uniref:Putative ovule protein n=1 Tax=Solanum chacoense TaxID=4108 RepID=A0A0V0GZ95_SOLCH